MKLVMTLLVRDEADIVRQNIDYHLRSGVDHIVATDNGSVDGTIEILEHYEDQGVLTLIHEPEQDYAQGKWVTRMAQIARDRVGADWIINNDADEFWVAPSGKLKASLDLPNISSVHCPRHHYFYLLGEDETVSWESRCFYRATTQTPRGEIKDRYNSPLPDYYFCLELPGKSAVRAKEFVSIHQGNHGADMRAEAQTGQTDIQIMHFPVRSTEQYRSKIVNGGQAYLRNPDLPEIYGWHWRRWYRWYEEDGQDPQRSLRECIPALSDAEALLSSGKVLKEEALVRSLFEGN